MNSIKEMLEIVKNCQISSTRLYLITRTLKTGVKAKTKAKDKYDFQCYSINIDDNVQNELLKIFMNKVTYLANEKKFSMEEYSIDVVNNDKIVYTLRKKAKIGSFIHILDIDIKDSTELLNVESLSDIVSILWSYIIEIKTPEHTILGLRKTTPNFVSVKKNKNLLTTMFSLKECMLSILSEQSLVFDDYLDAIYDNSIFYIVNKNNFEKIVGLEDEYIEKANEVADLLVSSPHFKINFDLKDQINIGGKFNRKLVKMRKLLSSIDIEFLLKMIETAKEFKLSFVVKDNQIVINNEDELDTVLKLLDDCYLLSKQTGNKYVASSKKVVIFT